MNYDEAKKLTQKFYDDFVETYIVRSAEKPEKTIAEFSALLSGVLGIKNILDAGCAGGNSAVSFLNLGFQVLGVDFSYQMCRAARSRGVPVIQADLEYLPFDVWEFAGIWARKSLVHIPQNSIPAVFKNFHKLLRKNGILYFDLKEGAGEELKTTKEGTTFFSYWETEEIKLALTEANFKVIKMTHGELDRFKEHRFLEIFAVRR
ncbi:MAG: hypothetical protein A3G49_00860 [Candidatus Sungbacteria bacterium RIFCSPLOWO2_12_FULL_41_11]|uniref:Methyltransferase domain-containing protein n=1 Tax=Candidatus Sungbacteria bacterium RIFCSPLOWO2_12_FULL_41_11 TaxID=1802286 RepID=A0A1G2LP07_9BACT|nr:MAG: Methyltransferase type 11 [Parcubacteria group bacterium GW2011_GWA2_42_14]OGZ98258.1 MAG: hypothetical protein A3D41_03560 [Candidatus Sungbacteria bacterium RIFCSPHIGHO2_02_FULL_41_12b]OHA13360.1 MAG: hypothetical protein A3G49_00860 [Candidatus Sungbacteria bacterium RIFCSPLOWO2_12_FULL_41_11]